MTLSRVCIGSTCGLGLLLLTLWTDFAMGGISDDCLNCICQMDADGCDESVICPKSCLETTLNFQIDSCQLSTPGQPTCEEFVRLYNAGEMKCWEEQTRTEWLQSTAAFWNNPRNPCNNKTTRNANRKKPDKLEKPVGSNGVVIGFLMAPKPQSANQYGYSDSSSYGGDSSSYGGDSDNYPTNSDTDGGGNYQYGGNGGGDGGGNYGQYGDGSSTVNYMDLVPNSATTTTTTTTPKPAVVPGDGIVVPSAPTTTTTTAATTTAENDYNAVPVDASAPASSQGSDGNTVHRKGLIPLSAFLIVVIMNLFH